MRNVLFALFIGLVIGAGTTWIIIQKKSPKAVSDPLKSEVVFTTDSSKTDGYYFPTHDNLLIMDRSNAEMAEAFIVQIAPGKFTHRHVHDDTEQLFYVLSGKGKMVLERLGRKETFNLLEQDFVHVPRNCFHQTFCEGTDSLKYLAIDCFPYGHNPKEMSWDDHARAVCEMNKWDYDEARKKKSL